MSTLLRDLPFPAIVEEIDYEVIVERKKEAVIALLEQKGITYVPSEADDVMTLIEMDSYEEMLLRTQINERIKQMFLAYATGSNLDHIGTTRFGVARLEGTMPKAEVKFELPLVRNSDIVIPHGLLLGDGESVAVLDESIIIRAGETQGVGTVTLQAFVKESDVQTTIVLTPLPWVVNVAMLSVFAGGADAEDDERYRDRIWLSRDRRTTAGSTNMYTFYAKSADVRVEEVAVLNGGAGVVQVFVLGEAMQTPDDLVESVDAYLSKDEIRPLTDTVIVAAAAIKNIVIDATLYANQTDLVDIEAIKARFAQYVGKFGTRLSIAKIYDLLGDSNIVDVALTEPTESVVCADAEDIAFVLRIEEAV